MASTQMASSVFLTLFFLVNLGSLRAANPRWDQSDVVVKQAPDTVLTISCRIDLGDDVFGVVRIFHKYSKNDTEVPISENDDLKDIFVKTGRYQVKSEQDPDSDRMQDRISTLIIQGVRGEDAGIYGCISVDDDEKVATINVKVQVPIEEVYMMSIRDATEIRVVEGATVHLDQGQTMGVGCVVTVDGSLQTPNVVITVDGEDRTQLFTSLISPQKIKKDDDDPVKFYTTVKYSYLTTVPDSELNQKNLTCVATAENFPSHQASAFLDVKFKPVITCPQYQIHTPKGEPLIVKCLLRSSPGAMITWSQGDERNVATEVDTANPESGISIKESPFNEDTTNLELVFDKVSSKHFTSYYLTATNDLGTNEVTITIKKGSTNTPTPKAEQGNQPSNTVDNPGEDPKADNVVSNLSTAVMTSVPLLLAHLCLLISLWSLHQ